ncbi:hypothetical protein [Peribacillus muralis]|uniref:hypothetical protein n=1 Tax=Peribacillus muralis TaxID=264697 RepID=UPI00367308EC
MEPYDSFNQHNDYYKSGNDAYPNVHRQNNENDLWAVPYPVEKQQMVERMPGPPGPSGFYQGAGQPSPPQLVPPLFIPTFTGEMLKSIDAGSLKGCLYQIAYVWLRNGRSFWFYPTYAGYHSVAGYRWRKSQLRWSYYGTDINEILAIQCF